MGQKEMFAVLSYEEARPGMDEGVRYIADQLELLLALPLSPRDALDEWYKRAREFERSMSSRSPGIEIPHDVWHFLADADIRSRADESAYRDSQEDLVRRFISELRRLDITG